MSEYLAKSYDKALRENAALRLRLAEVDQANERFAIRVLGQEAYDNSPCQAHPLELVEVEIESLRSRLAEVERTLADANARGDMLQFKLAEAEALLREAQGYPHPILGGKIDRYFRRDADSANERRCECGERLSGHEDESSTKCRWCVTGWKPSKDDQADSASGEGEK